MNNFEIVRLDPKDYDKCNNIWDMSKNPTQAKFWYDELVSGNRVIYVYAENDEYLGEGSLVIERNDPDYSIPNQRIYLSRLVDKASERGRGIGSLLLDYIVSEANSMGYREISIGVDKDSHVALNLYKKRGFTEVLYDGEDEHGPYYKLLKKLADVCTCGGEAST